MKKSSAEYIFIAVFLIFFICNKPCYGNDLFNLLSLNTAPITLTDEENFESKETKTTAPQNNENPSSVSVNPFNPNNINTVNNTTNNSKKTVKNTQPTVYKSNSTNKSIDESLTKQTKTTTRKITQMEVLDYDAEDNVFKNKEAESFLLVPIDKEELKREEQNNKREELSLLLTKDTPKNLSTASKIKSKFSTFIFNEKQNAKLSKIDKLKLFVLFLVKIGLLLSIFIVLGYMIYIKKKNEDKNDPEKILTRDEQRRKDLIQAIEEFEQTEEQHKKLPQQKYINKIETYKSLDNLKEDEVADDIINTMKTIEQAQKNKPLITNKSNQGFKKTVYAFENDIGILSDKEGMALFNEDESTNENDDNIEDISILDYYNAHSEAFSSENDILNDDIFIIEDNDEIEDDDEYKIVEEPSLKETKPEKHEEIAENNEESNSNQEEIKEELTEQNKTDNQEKTETIQQKPETKKPESELKVKEKYPLDDNRGLALLSYKHNIALIGYIGDKITILKRFLKGDKAENLSVRIYEELSDNSTQYLVRVGKYKGIIEISDSEIKLVLNL